MKACLSWSWSLLFLLVALASPALGQFQDLAAKIPNSANVVAFVNVEKLMASPIAIQQDWASKRDKAFSSGVSFLPPDAKHAVLAMDMDLQLWTPVWEAAVIELDHNPDMAKVAQMTGGAPDVIADLQVVALPSDAYVVKFDTETAAFMAPANRQSTTRWLRSVLAKNDLNLSPYLFEAFKYANDRGTPVIVAIDLEGAFPIGEVRAHLAAGGDFVKQNKLDPELVAQTIAGVRGITLGVTFSDKPFGKVKIDFTDDISLAPEMAKAAMIHAFSNHGVMLNEFYDWKPEVSGKSASLEGFLTPSGMRRVSSLFNRPPSLKPLDPAKVATPKSKEEIMKEASIAYFHAVEGQLQDLKQTKQGTAVSSMGQIGVWMSKYANKIDQLSVLYVDPELVDYGAYVSDTLRSSYNAIRSGAARSRIRQVDTPMQYDYYTQTNTYGYTVRDGWFGGGYTPYGYTNTYAVPDQQAYIHARTQAATEERVTSGNQARDIFQGIEKATGDIKRKMTQKYSADF
ncbi:hypothetical protein ETAA8_44690 [Anatilimnocola aggregata]|uniref:Uncharacterized protein n=1 Tax=Anatilimnocola aggregata TaxID=2528021 RepID=A0A517YGK5_9BACT|nr:hypothetical protein [Anatilimnocola aggregata]QDU29360.1 hypothetical protein ETAA8_44690 [Anatilimnocola aggregata]